MNGKQASSIKTKLLLYFLIFVVIIFSVLWILQVIFLQSCYSFMIKTELIKVGNTIKSSIENRDKLDIISFQNSFNIMAFTENGELIYCSNYAEKPFYIDFSQARVNLSSSSKDYATYTINIPKMESSIIVYISKVSSGYVLVSTSLEPIAATSRVISNQLIYITIILLIISVIISAKISNKLAKPIEQITEKAEKLGKGRYDIEFELDSSYSELNNLAETLNYSAKELSKTDRLRKELIANVSHDIKTPLTIIKGYAEMIKDISGTNKEKREEHLNVIINQTDLLTKLADDMMDLSKLETGVSKLNITQYDLKYEIIKVIQGFECIGEIKFEFLYDELDSYIIEADMLKINQVLYNLISNAINYVGEDKTVYITLNYEANKNLKVEVKDTGKGIEDTTHIFDRYYKSNDKFRKSGYGTGLGLSIVKNILELHGFEYGVESKLGEGTKFYFNIKI